MVSFGDSLSDVGTYAPATSLTGNGQPPSSAASSRPTRRARPRVWVENLAASLGITITPAEVGFNGQSVKCPHRRRTPPLAGTCTGYGQGGSRVTDPMGIGHNADGSGALTVPVVTQIANHLARFTSFKDSDLIFVYAGSNDVFTQFGIFAAAAAQIQAATAPLDGRPDEPAAVRGAAAAEAAMKQAATSLVNGHRRRRSWPRGGEYVAVMTLSDISATPFGQSLPATAQPVLTDLVAASSTSGCATAWTGQPVQIIDTFALFQNLAANSASLGFVNTTVPACDATKITAITGGADTDGSSLFCNATPGAPYNGIRTGADVNTWFFADSVHPTTGGHKAISDAFTLQLKAFGWI